MSQSQKNAEEYFEHPIFCSTLISNNACMYEIEKLMKNREIYFDFPYNKQLFFISQIDDVESKEVPNTNQPKNVVQQYYEQRGKQQELYHHKNPIPNYKTNNEYYQQQQQYIQQKSQNKKDVWRKITLDYFILENEKKIYLKDKKVIRKEEIYEHMKRIKKNNASETSQQSQNEESENPQKSNDIEVLDGIYFFSDFLEKNQKNGDNSKLMEEYVEKIFDQFNKSVIYSFLSYFVSVCVQKLISKDIFIDIDLRNFILIRENQNIKFVYIISFEDFKTNLECKMIEDSTFNYEQFCSVIYHFDKAPEPEKSTAEYRMKQPTLNSKFQERYRILLQQVADCLLNKADIKEAQDDSVFAKDCLDGKVNIEEALKNQDSRKRYCKVLITKNHLLTAITQNFDVQKIFKQLYEKEQDNFQQSSNDNFFTQSEILNSFFQDCLKRANGTVIPDSKQNEKERDTLIEFICEDYPKQQNGILQPINVPQREKSKTPQFILQTKFDKTVDQIQKEHEISSLSTSKREMQIQLKIKESKHPMIQENSIKQKIDELKAEDSKLRAKKDERNNQQILQIQEELKKQEQQLNAIVNQAPIRGGEKKLMIDFKEMSCSISIKLYYQSELYVLYENVDEMLFCIQLLNNNFNDISIYMDDNKRIFFETFVCMGQTDRALLRVVYMIDSILTYALTFFDFYYQNMTNSKSSRDISKYVQLQQEISQYMLAYKFKFDEFVDKIEVKKAQEPPQNTQTTTVKMN